MYTWEMASEIDELKEIVRNQGRIIEDTNRELHKMRRAAKWSMFFKFLWWALIFAVSYGVYVYYLEPYINSIMQAYERVQQAGGQAQTFQQMFADSMHSFFAQFSGTSTK